MSANESSLVRDGSGGEFQEQWAHHLRQLWQEAKDARVPGVPAEEVLDRVERKYLPLVEGIEQKQGAAAANRVRSRLEQMKSFPLAIQRNESSS